MSTNIGKWRPTVAATAIALWLLPGVGMGQETGPSFGDLARSVKNGQIVIVTDDAGQKTQGKVAEVSEASLIILTRASNGQWASRATFTPLNVQEIRRPGRIWDKAVLGLGIGAGIGLIAAANCDHCDAADNAAGVMLTGGIGAGIGLAFDAAIGAKVVYRAPAARRAGVTAMPMLGPDRSGVFVAYRF